MATESTGLLYDPFEQQRKGRYSSQMWNPYFKIAAIIIGLLFIGDQLGRLTEKHELDHNYHTLNFKIFNNNVRYDSKNPVKNERPWSERKIELYKSIKFSSFNTVTIVTLQEVLKNQLDDILTLLNQDEDANWSYVGVGRNDGAEAGEYSPIFYNKEEIELVNSSTFWLSETPDVPSKGWDANQFRIVTWAHLKFKDNERKINVFNTHLDHVGKVSRKESVKLIASKTTSYNNDVSFITGDFNSEPHEEAYQTLSKVFNDSRLNNKLKYGYENTFTGFESSDELKVIDYVFIDPRLGSVEGFGVLGNSYDGLLASDHRPLVVEVSIQPHI